MLLIKFIIVYCRVNILEMSVLIPVSGVYLDKEVGCGVGGMIIYEAPTTGQGLSRALHPICI